MTKAEKRENELILSRGCFVCGNPSAEIHHVRRLATSKKRGNAPKLPLCFECHRGNAGIHSGRKSWEWAHGNEVDLAKEVYQHFGLEWKF